MSLPILDPGRQLPNRTRRSESILRRLVAEGKYHLLPVYALLTTSDLAREGIRNSGSFRFADHIYRNEPSGRYGLGRLLDRVLLGLRGARSMRSRFFHSRREVLRAVRAIGLSEGMTMRFGSAASAMPGIVESGGWKAQSDADRTSTNPIVVVSVPCGIARDLLEVAETLETAEPALREHLVFIGIDLDSEALDLSRDLVAGQSGFEFRCADALEAGSLPEGVDIIVSLGFGEFLTDDVLVDFYRRCRASLRSEGRLITSAMSRDKVADYLARELAELHTNYRSSEHLGELLKSAGFARVRTTRDRVGLQTLAVAEKTQ